MEALNTIRWRGGGFKDSKRLFLSDSRYHTSRSDSVADKTADLLAYQIEKMLWMADDSFYPTPGH